MGKLRKGEVWLIHQRDGLEHRTNAELDGRYSILPYFWVETLEAGKEWREKGREGRMERVEGLEKGREGRKELGDWRKKENDR